jgi:hypothetical protein
MTGLRTLALATLTLLMTVTGIGAATARGQMAADGVICGTGTYAVVIAADGLPLFDDTGKPVLVQDAPCLDCTIGIWALSPDVPDTLSVDAASDRLGGTPYLSSAPPLWRMGGMGRSPPRAA